MFTKADIASTALDDDDFEVISDEILAAQL